MSTNTGGNPPAVPLMVRQPTDLDGIVTFGDASMYEERSERWLPCPLLSTLDDAAAFVDRLGFALLFPAESIPAPSLWEAVAGDEARPFATGMGPAESLVWEWKDELPRQGLAWYGTLLYRRKSLLCPALLAALYPGPGTETDHRDLDLSAEAHTIANALRGGPLTTAALREIVGNRARYDRAMGELNRSLLVTSAGVQAQAAGWPAGIVELTCRVFTVGKSTDAGYAVARFLDTVRFATPRDLSRAYGWPVARSRAELERLATTETAVRRERDGYRALTPLG